MASHQANRAKTLSNSVASHNGWTSNYAESEGAVDNRVGGEPRDTHSTPIVDARQRSFPRRPRGAEFFPNQFWRHVAKGDRKSCWLWQGTILERNGYGTFWHPGLKATLLAHRLAWMLSKGDIPQGLKTLHKCDVPACCNPHHLRLGTQADNMRDMIAKGRRSPDAHTPKGHKWTPEHRAAMMAARQRGRMQRDRARQKKAS